MTEPTVDEDLSGPFVLQGRSLIVGVVIAAVIAWLARPIIGPFIVAAVIAYAFGPVVSAVQVRTGLARPVIVLLGYVIVVAVLIVAGYFIIGRLIREMELLNVAGPDSLAHALRQLLGSDTVVIGSQQITVTQVAQAIQDTLTKLIASPGSDVQMASRVGEVALQTLLAMIVTFYFLIDGQRLRDGTISVLPPRHRRRTVAVLDRIHLVLGKWLRGQLLLMLIVAIVVYIVLGPILHLPYALAIAALTGVLEIIPLIGPVVATVIAATNAFVHAGSGVAIGVIVFYFVLRQVEDQVVMPQVVGRTVHLHPVVTIFAVLVGLSTYGVLGGLLGVPVAAAINVVFRELGRPDSVEPTAP